ncbi:uncharacterized protein LOC110432583 [Sorghum bicolor]|uniref:uncharacterized protein LOC110432583 n=1 Tax=Sorghum bicolor TaxID=4558 RepID=UPI000B423908|nr:uncharacterized protein LOC110432583 [Sorghum bicolor]|eukprot:XP_021309005.1 uncharacterized protein LOC110432583 [Sorghum bicolor]
MDEEMRAWWCANCPDAWEAMVDKWLDPVFREAHRAAQERRRRMPGVAHHQGNRSLSGYAQAWSAAHGGQPCSLFAAYGMSHKGPASSDVSFSVDDPPEAYTNAGVYDKVTAYAQEAARSMGATGLATASSTGRLLPPSPRSEHRPRA